MNAQQIAQQMAEAIPAAPADLQQDDSDTSTEPMVGWEFFIPKMGFNPNVAADRDEVPTHQGWEVVSQDWSRLNLSLNVFCYNSNSTNCGRMYRYEMQYQTPIGKIYVYVPHIDDFTWTQPAANGYHVRLFREIPGPLMLQWNTVECMGMIRLEVMYATTGNSLFDIAFFLHERITFARMSHMVDTRSTLVLALLSLLLAAMLCHTIIHKFPCHIIYTPVCFSFLIHTIIIRTSVQSQVHGQDAVSNVICRCS